MLSNGCGSVSSCLFWVWFLAGLLHAHARSIGGSQTDPYGSRRVMSLMGLKLFLVPGVLSFRSFVFYHGEVS